MRRYWHTHWHASLTSSMETNFLKYFGHLSIDKAGSPNKVELKLDQWIYFNCSSDLEPDLSACLQTSRRRATPPSTFILWLAVDARNHLLLHPDQDSNTQEAARLPWPDCSPFFLTASGWQGAVKSGLEENRWEHNYPWTRTSNVVFLLQVTLCISNCDIIDLCFSSC